MSQTGGPRDAAGEGEVDHEVARKVHGGADGEHGPRLGHLVEEPRGDADVAAEVLEEGERGDSAVAVAQRRPERTGLDAEGVRRTRRRQDQQERKQREPTPRQDLPGEPRAPSATPPPRHYRR